MKSLRTAALILVAALAGDAAAAALFDFEAGLPAGWTSGGGTCVQKPTQCPGYPWPSPTDPRPFTWDSFGTGTGSTGPVAGAGGSTYYFYAETSNLEVGFPNSLFTLGYDGSACAGDVTKVSFEYNMYGLAIGTLNLVAFDDAPGSSSWSLSGDQGTGWKCASVDVNSASFTFEYTSGANFRGDAALDNVFVCCNPLDDTSCSCPPPPSPPPPSPSPPPPSPSPPPPSLEDDGGKDTSGGASLEPAPTQEAVNQKAVEAVDKVNNKPLLFGADSIFDAKASPILAGGAAFAAMAIMVPAFAGLVIHVAKHGRRAFINLRES